MIRRTTPALTIKPLTPDLWPPFEELFGPRGACGGCWCMTPRLTRSDYEANKGAGNKRAMRALVDAGETPGVIAFDGEAPVAWCSLGPRSGFGSLARSRILKPVDDREVWSIVCLFVAKAARRKGVSIKIIDAACDYAALRGATCMEGYPVEPKKDDMPPVFAYTGIASAYLAAGFHEVARRSETRPIMRREL